MDQSQTTSQNLPAEIQQEFRPDESVLYVAHGDVQAVRIFLTILLGGFFAFCIIMCVIMGRDVPAQDLVVALIKSIQFQLAFLLTVFSQILFFQRHRTAIYVITNKNFYWGFRLWRKTPYVKKKVEISPEMKAKTNGLQLIVNAGSQRLNLGPIKDVADFARGLNEVAAQNPKLAS